MASPKVKPAILKGTRDFLPDKMVKRAYLVDTIRRVFERFGFDPLETPAIERWETLSGKYGEEGERLIYRFQDRGGRDLGLRYDLTVPLARVVAMYPHLPKPFKRYQIQPVWRAEKPQKGRFREFVQCDVDIVGTPEMLADAEIIAVVYAALTELGLQGFRIKINNRKVIRGMIEVAGAPIEQELDIARAIDKLDKIGVEGVRKELEKRGVAPDVIDRILEIMTIRGADDTTFQDAEKTLGASPSAKEGLEELRQVFEYLSFMGLPQGVYELDLSLVRGLDYYTGPVFETVMEEPKIGSIMGGGRYDRLIGIFTGQDIPATGTSIGLDRLVTVMDELDAWPIQTQTRTEVLVLRFDPALTPLYLQIAQDLRNAGFNTDLYTGKKNIRAQLGYAKDRGIPVVIIIGSDEAKARTVSVRYMPTGDQVTLRQSELVPYLRHLLEKGE